MKATLTSIVIAILLIGGALFLASSGQNNTGSTNANNVSIVDGVQIIEINAKGGYQPRSSTAKAGLPTILRFNTNSTFDCSSSVRIPSMNISKSLPMSGVVDIDLGTREPGNLNGMCGMGMYRFDIKFY
jgi:plastocyanin domain-containing protein